ncbi:MAG: L-fucose:H+ symporter permease [Muribaculum sp.]|nr:L-fucose:H+ symporter permease [Muribaculum sp.]
MENKTNRVVTRQYLVPFILITSLFALWGFANDITNPMVAAFQKVMQISATKASMVQFAFYGGYTTMAIPAALFIRRYSYKSGILLGLGLYAIGAFLFIPAAAYQQFSFFCISLYILTFGLAFLETTANPYILSMGTKETSTRRLNLAQSFNPMGSLTGMAIASFVVLRNLQSAEVNNFGDLDSASQNAIRLHDLAVIRDPYVAIGLVVLCMFIIIALTKMPRTQIKEPDMRASDTLRRLWRNVPYREGVMAQMFYVGAQIMVWTFIIQYAENIGIKASDAQLCNMLAMGLCLTGRFVSSIFLMRYINTRLLLAIFGIGAACCTVGAIAIVGIGGLCCLIGISLFMSLMFPTIYGIALENVSTEDSTIGAAFLVMAILGGALMPPMQGLIIVQGSIAGFPAVNLSFILPLICFIVVTSYGFRAYRYR